MDVQAKQRASIRTTERGGLVAELVLMRMMFLVGTRRVEALSSGAKACTASGRLGQSTSRSTGEDNSRKVV